MFCSKCGTSIQSDWAICPKCGAPVHNVDVHIPENNINASNQSIQNAQTVQPQYNYGSTQFSQQSYSSPQPKKNHKKLIIILGCVIALIAILSIIGYFVDDSANNDYTDTINKLKSITTVTADNDSYQFKNGNYWTIKYTDSNEFAQIHEALIADSLSDWFGTKNLGCDSTFAYDFSENTIRIYLNYTDYQGTLSIINYDISNDEFTLNFNGDHYTASDDFEAYLRRCGIIKLLKADIDDFKLDLSNNGISYDKIKNIKYNNVKKVIN